jgi:hypothetical protein
VPLVPPPRPGGRPRTDMRAAMNAILYLLRTGCICCGPAAPGAICRATAFRRARPFTISFASSSAMESGRRSGPSCIWHCHRPQGRQPRGRGFREHARRRAASDDLPARIYRGSEDRVDGAGLRRLGKEPPRDPGPRDPASSRCPRSRPRAGQWARR